MSSSSSSSSWLPSSCSSSSSSSGSCRRRISEATEWSEEAESGHSGCILLMSNGTPRSLWQRSDKGQRTERQAAPTSRLLWCHAVGDFSHELPSITVLRHKTSVIFVPHSPAGILFASDLKLLDTHGEFLRGWLIVDSTALVDRIDRLRYRNSSYLQMGSRNRKSQSPTCGA